MVCRQAVRETSECASAPSVTTRAGASRWRQLWQLRRRCKRPHFKWLSQSIIFPLWHSGDCWGKLDLPWVIFQNVRLGDASERAADIHSRARRCWRLALIMFISLIMECASQFAADAVLARAVRLQVHVVLVPARCAHILQPLDVNTLASLKRRYHEWQLETRASRPDGTLWATGWVDCLESFVCQVLVERCWGDAMASRGATGKFDTLRPRLRNALTGVMPLPLRPPIDEEVSDIIGRLRPG